MDGVSSEMFQACFLQKAIIGSIENVFSRAYLSLRWTNDSGIFILHWEVRSKSILEAPQKQLKQRDQEKLIKTRGELLDHEIRNFKT